jgi:hypothetical protein
MILGICLILFQDEYVAIAFLDGMQLITNNSNANYCIIVIIDGNRTQNTD